MKRSHWNILICALGTAVVVSCGAPGVPIPPSLELAKPVTDLRAARKGNKVFLAWTVPSKTVDRQSIRHPGDTLICRSLKMPVSDCKSPAAEVPATQFPLPPAQKDTAAAKVEASFTDVLPEQLQRQDPTADLSYAVWVQNESGRAAGLSNQVEVPSAPTLAPPDHFRADVKRDGVLLSWDCLSAPPAPPNIGYRLRLYRREQGTKADSRISEVNLGTCSPAQPSEFLDQTFEWEKHYNYRATVVTAISEAAQPEVEVEGDDSPVVTVFAHDVFPPAVPTGLQAVFSGVGQTPFVDVVWSPDTEADLAGYNVFRHEAGAAPVKLNSEPVKTPAFRDSTVQSGKRYFYSVSAVDDRNNESEKSEETSEQVP